MKILINKTNEFICCEDIEYFDGIEWEIAD